MDVSMMNTNFALGVNPLKKEVVTQSEGTAKEDVITKNNETLLNNMQDVFQLSRNDVKNITQELNNFLELINSDLQFAVHDETQQLIVQVVDTRNQRILKEFPPHELLDTIAKISDYVGILLDKKV